MAVKITYFVHGTTTDNEKGIASGWSGVGLSELGIKQSKELKDKIDVKSFDVVFCSDNIFQHRVLNRFEHRVFWKSVSRNHFLPACAGKRC